MSYTPSREGDPGKLAYLHNPNWRGKLFSRGMQVDPRVCPGCLFPGSKPATEHVNDERCQHFRTAQVAAQIEGGCFAADAESEGKWVTCAKCGGPLFVKTEMLSYYYDCGIQHPAGECQRRGAPADKGGKAK